jgi:hypothetical protein
MTYRSINFKDTAQQPVSLRFQLISWCERARHRVNRLLAQSRSFVTMNDVLAVEKESDSVALRAAAQPLQKTQGMAPGQALIDPCESVLSAMP